MQAQSTSLEACLAREACYRVIGEVTPLPEQINFVSWYQSELQSLLQACLQMLGYKLLHLPILSIQGR